MFTSSAPADDAPLLPARVPTREALDVMNQAAALLAEGQCIQTSPLLAPYRALRPVGHPQAHRSTMDLPFLASVVAFGGVDLVCAGHLLLKQKKSRTLPHVDVSENAAILWLPTSPTAVGDGLALVLGLCVEAEKAKAIFGGDRLPPTSILLERLGLSAGEASELFNDTQQLNDVMGGLIAGGEDRSLYCTPPRDDPNKNEHLDWSSPFILGDSSSLKEAGETHEVFVIAGATDRLYDMVSPYVRHLSSQLTAVAGSNDADDLYSILPLLFHSEDHAQEERFAAEKQRGISRLGDALIVNPAHLDVRLADPRLQSILRKHSTKRSLFILTGPSPKSLERVLAACKHQCRAVFVLSEALLGDGRPRWPEILGDPSQGTLVEVRNAFIPADLEATNPAASDLEPTMHQSLFTASLGLTPHDDALNQWQDNASFDPLLFPLMQTLIDARARGHLTRTTPIYMGVTSPGVPQSQLAVKALESILVTSKQ